MFLFRRMTWSVRSSLNDSSFSPSTSNGSNGRTRIIRVIQEFQTKLGSKIQEVKKNLPMKLLFFLVGFYCATAFATVIGQTGDWDILSAALAVAVVEGIGALMYRASLPLVRKSRSLISLFNYWKAGLTLGLFLDSFKYWFDLIIGCSNPFHVKLKFLSVLMMLGIFYAIDSLSLQFLYVWYRQKLQFSAWKLELVQVLRLKSLKASSHIQKLCHSSYEVNHTYLWST